MKKVISKENLHLFAYINDQSIISNKDVKAIIIEFRGLGAMTMFDETERGKFFGEKNILYVIPYLNPWNWMNSTSINETDEIIDVVKEIYGKDLKIISTGMSMGGLCSLVYPKYSKHEIIGVVSNCPVCDLPYHYTERPDLPRTLYSAFYNDDESGDDIMDILEQYSPLHLAISQSLPKIKYTIFHCTSDHAVNIDKHSVKFVSAISKYHEINFVKVLDHDHCDLGDENKHFDEVILSYL